MRIDRTPVFLVDDHAVVRDGVRRLIEESGEFVVTGEAASAAEALSELTRTPARILVSDIALPGRDGVSLLKQVREVHPALRVLIFSMYAEETYAVRVIKLGASGYLSKVSAPDLLMMAIRKISEGGLYITPTLAERLAAELSTGRRTPAEELSAREMEVLRRIVHGERLTDIATSLNLSVKTVSSYRHRILAKTGLQGNMDLIRYAMENGLIKP